MNLPPIGRFLRTLRYVPVRQIVARVLYRLRCVWYVSPFYSFFQEPAQVPEALQFHAPQLWEGDAQKGEMVAEHTFRLAERTITMGKALTWAPVEASMLWTFTLHYHEWLGDLYAAKRQEDAARLLEDWLLHCDHFHKIYWHPYPLSLRLVSWMTYGPWAVENSVSTLQEAFYTSLVRQLTHLRRNLERDLGGNHLIKNLKALIYGGLLVPNQQGLYLMAMPMLLKELKKQILSDGAHYELSPSYHVQVLQDLLDIHAVLMKANQPIPAQLDDALERMTVALAVYRHPDGGLALFNDGAEGDRALLERLAKRMGSVDVLPESLPDAGYYRLQRGPVWLLVDGGLVGPDENPGHAHADTLSFEMSLAGQRVFVNAGTYAYQHMKRPFFRSTAAHNTVTVEGRDSAEVWKHFRVGRRPRKVVASLRNTPGKDMVWEGSHDGYRADKMVHKRRLTLASDGSVLRGEDDVTAPAKARDRVMAHFHIHPDVQVTVQGEKEAFLTLSDGQQWRFQVQGGRLYEKESVYAPQFGVLLETKQLIVQGRLQKGQCGFTWHVRPVS